MSIMELAEFVTHTHEIQFAQFAGMVRQEVGEYFPDALDRMILGPTYFGTTSKGVEVAIDTAVVQKPEDTREHVDQRLYFFGYGNNHLASLLAAKLEGDRNVVLSGSRRLHVRDRNLGIARVMDEAVNDMFRRYASRLGTPIIETIINENLADLLKLWERSKDELNNTPLRIILEDKIIEQERWQTLYGSEKQVDPFVTQERFHTRGKPDALYRVDPAALEAVHLYRLPGTSQTVISHQTTRNNVEELRQKKFERFTQVLNDVSGII